MASSILEHGKHIKTEDELEEQSLNKSFEKAFELFRSINDFEGETTNSQFQDKLQKGISLCEDITRSVTSVDMFSGNESLDELPTAHIKFLLLPFMLGKLWQLKTEKERKDVCVASQIYFQDFLQRLHDYGIIKSLPAVMDKDEAKRKAMEVNSNDLRARKIALLKENKALDSKIRALLERQKNNEDLDDDTARELFLSVIQRSHNEAVQELDSVAKELELIEFAAKMKDPNNKAGGDPSRPPPEPKKSSGIQTFILTRSDVEKKVFGLGYPALPVMTVDELYAQRRAEGTWGPPAGPVHIPSTDDQQEEDREAELNEIKDETEDPERLQQLRNLDEYKDMHRRGWGNRMNRS